MKFDREKYTELIMYILSRCSNKPQLGKTVLCSILYFIDFNYYEQYGKLLTKESYSKSKKGIKPKHFKEVTQDLINTKQLFLKKIPYYNRTLYRYYPLIIPNVKFPKNELKIIDLSIKNLSDNNALNITRYANNDPPLASAKLGDEIDCRYVLLRPKKYSIRLKK